MFATQEQCQQALTVGDQSLVGGIEMQLFAGAWVAGFSLVSFFSAVNNIYKLLALNSIFRKK